MSISGHRVPDSLKGAFIASESQLTTESKDLVAVDINRFRSATRDIEFDVYIRLADDNMAHLFSRTTGLDYKRLAQYIQKGVKTLYIAASDQVIFERFTARSAQAIFLDPATPLEKKIATLLNMTEQNIAEIFSQFAVEEETAANTQKIIRNYVNLMMSNPTALNIILKLVAHGDYLYYHSVAVAIFSMFLARASGHFNQRMLEIVSLGGFLHDIGCTQLPRDITDGPNLLTADQYVEFTTHPTIGLKMIENTRSIPDEVRYIVYQHHEQPNGEGYPNKIRGGVIYYPAKIVALADAFSALISQRPYRNAMSVEEALRTIEDSPGRYDRDLVKILTQTFHPTRLKAA